jgi:hypothetical protein
MLEETNFSIVLQTGRFNFWHCQLRSLCRNIHYHLQMEYISLTDSIGKYLTYIRSVFESAEITESQVDTTGVSTVSFDARVMQVICHYKLVLSHILSDISIPIVRPYLAHWLRHQIPPQWQEWIWAHGGVPNRQGMLTPPMHMIPPPLYPWFHVRTFFLWLDIPTCVSRLITLWYLSHFIILY